MARPLNANFLPEDPIDVSYQLQDADGAPVGAVVSEAGNGIKKWALGTWRSFTPELVDTTGAIGVLWSGRLGGSAAAVRVLTTGDRRVLTSGAVRVLVGSGSGEIIYQTENFDVATGGLTGPNDVQIEFLDANLDPVPNVTFTQVGIGAGQADANGIASFGSVAGTFDIVAGGIVGVLFPVTSLVVAGSTSIQIIGTGVLVSIPLPTAPDPFCDVIMDFRDGAGVEVEGGLLKLTLITPGGLPAKTLAGQVLHSPVVFSGTSLANGRATVRVLRTNAFETAGVLWQIESSAKDWQTRRVEILNPAYDAGTVVL